MHKAQIMRHRLIVKEVKNILTLLGQPRGFTKNSFTFYANRGALFVPFMRPRYQYSAELHCQSSGTLSNIAIPILKFTIISLPSNFLVVLTCQINSVND